MGALCTPLKEMPIMPASSSVMPWEIGEYWGMGHFQNNGAAGGLDLRHRYYRYTGIPFLIAGDVYCLSIASAFVDFWGAVSPPLGDAAASLAFLFHVFSALS